MPKNPPESRMQKAIDILREKHPEAIDPAVQKTLTIDQGHVYESELIYVTYMKPGANPQSPPRSAIYFPAFREPMHFEGSDEFVKWFAGRRSRTETSAVGKLLEVSGGIAGLLAVMITGALLYKFVQAGGESMKTPEWISSALGTVLGFYFGGKAKAAKENQNS